MKNRIIKSGSLLISEPFLGDPHFNRSVIVICEHNEMQGSFGLVLNSSAGAGSFIMFTYCRSQFQNGPPSGNKYSKL